MQHASSRLPRALRYRREPVPLHFPAEAEVPETKRHLKLRTFLFQILELELAGRACIGSDQFVYWNAADPRRALAPNAFVRLGAPDADFQSWKTWERGTPDIAAEIVSESDAGEEALEEKLRKYHELGVRELVRFDPDAPANEQLRMWDRVEGDLVEREVEGALARSQQLDLWWIVAPGAGFDAALRLSRDGAGEVLLPSPEEARVAAERRVAELEEELRRRR